MNVYFYVIYVRMQAWERLYAVKMLQVIDVHVCRFNFNKHSQIYTVLISAGGKLDPISLAVECLNFFSLCSILNYTLF